MYINNLYSYNFRYR